MQKIMKYVLGTLAVLCAIFFVGTAMAALILFNVERRAFDPATYKQALIDENFYQQFPAVLGDLLEKNVSNNTTNFVKQLTANNWATIIQALLPPQQLQSMTEDTLSQIFGYINGEISNPRLSLLPLKQGLASQAGLDAAITIIHSQPACTLDQIAKMVTSFGQELCNPPEQMLNLARPVIQAQLNAAAAAIPDDISLGGPEASNTRLKDLRTMRLAMRLSPLIPLAFLFGITIFAVRTLKGWLAWWGWPMLIAGILGSLSGFAGAPFFRLLVERFLARRIPITMPQELVNAVRAVADAALRQMLLPAGWEGLVLAILGLIMVLVSFAISAGQKAKQLARSEAKTQVY